jgi:hypothetical protein
VRHPLETERLYLDFDGFFASVEQQAHPHLRGKPVGVVPFKDAQHTCVIACSREAKLAGVKNVMNIEEARERCPDIILVPQSPDLYRRAHNTLLSEISAVILVDAVKSIDELTCRVAPANAIRAPRPAHQVADCRPCRPFMLLDRLCRQSSARQDGVQGGQAERQHGLASQRHAGAAAEGHADIPVSASGWSIGFRVSVSRRWPHCSPRSPSTCASCGAT